MEMLVAAAVTYALHRVLQRQKGQVVADAETGQQVTERHNHSLFFVPVKWWPIAFIAIGVAMMFVSTSP